MPRLRERISLRGLLIVLGSVGLALVVVAAALVFASAQQVSAEAERMTNVYEPAAANVYTLNLATSEMERGVSLYLVGGYEADLRPYVDGERRSAIALSALKRLLGDDAAVSPLIDAVESSRGQWLERVAGPAIAAKRDGNPQEAQTLVLGNESLVLFDRFVTDSDRLRNTIDAARSDAFDDLTELTTRLSVLAGIAMLVLLGAVLIAWSLMFRWVLTPLQELREQMQRVARARDVDARIVPGGPREIAAVGRDAEQMRRQLVEGMDTTVRAEDAARRANQSLASNAPVVSAIMRELATQTDAQPDGVEVCGEVHAAETVLGGDFWDCIQVPDGQSALVLADIAGHGDEVAVAAMRIKHLLAVALASGRSPGSALALAARRMKDEDEPIATAAIAVVDPVTETVTWSNAGHHPPVILHRGGEVEELARTGPLLSWLGGPWEVRTSALHHGDVLLLFSDGLVESHDASGVQLGAEGLVRLVADARSATDDVDGLVRRTLASARLRAADWERDDVTLVALTPRPPTP